ncbi:MAG: response regulator [bacterium]
MNKSKIMIVEDEAIIREDLRISLEGMGYAIIASVATGEAAIEKAGKDRPDIILMDVQLHGPMDGIEAAEIIKSGFGIPVVFLTAHADEERLQRAKLILPFGYMLKPFQNQQVKAAIEMALYVAQVDAQRIRAEEELKEHKKALIKKTDDLGKRIKELNCLYGICNLFEGQEVSYEEIMQGIVALIPSS